MCAESPSTVQVQLVMEHKASQNMSEHLSQFFVLKIILYFSSLLLTSIARVFCTVLLCMSVHIPYYEVLTLSRCPESHGLSHAFCSPGKTWHELWL